MSFFTKTIFTGFEPNLSARDVRFGLNLLMNPIHWRHWQRGVNHDVAERYIEMLYVGSNAALFDSGRTALFIALKSLGIKPGDEVLLQAYTCIVVVNAIRWAGGIPVFVDVKNDYTIDPVDLVKKCTSKTRVILVQHTFGIPSDMSTICGIAKERGFKIIEDCAHVIGGTLNGKQLGTFGDMAIISFGSDKPVSCVRGGAILLPDQSPYKQKVYELQRNLHDTDPFTIALHLAHYVYFPIGKALYHMGVGKLFLGIVKRLHLMSRNIEEPEKRGKQVFPYPARLPNVLSMLLLVQLRRITDMNDRRREISAAYWKSVPDVMKPAAPQDVPYVRFPLCVKNPSAFRAAAKANGVMLGDWYDTVVAPKSVPAEHTAYTPGSCPNAEALAAVSVNLPTDSHIRERDIKRIVTFLQSYV